MPGDPNLILSGLLAVRTGLVSVNPYPSKIIISREAKNSAIFLDNGAPPEIKNLIFFVVGIINYS